MTAVTNRQTRRQPRASARPRAAAKAVKTVRFDSIHETFAGTNEEHVKTVLGELPWMRLGIAILNLNDRELEAKIYGSDEETQRSFCDLADTMMAIRNRYQAGIDLCNAVSARILIVFDRLQAETGAGR